MRDDGTQNYIYIVFKPERGVGGHFRFRYGVADPYVEPVVEEGPPYYSPEYVIFVYCFISVLLPALLAFYIQRRKYLNLPKGVMPWEVNRKFYPTDDPFKGKTDYEAYETWQKL